MRNGDLIINGKLISEIDLDAIKNFDEFYNNFYSLIWDAVDAKYGKEEGKKFQTDSDVFDEDYCARIQATRQRLSDLEEKERWEEEKKKPINIDGVNYYKLDRFDIYWSGWECDSVGWIVTDGTKRAIMMTDHGTPKLVEADRLEGFIKQYQTAIQKMQEAIKYVNGE